MPGTHAAVPGDLLASVDPQTLLGADADAFEAVLACENTGPLAVVGPPYGGRERVLAAAADRLDATRLTLGPGDGPGAAVDALGDGPVVLAGCQHLFERRVGGFEPLSTVFDALADVRAPVVTGWNATAWAYLSAVQPVERSIPAAVAVDPLDAGAMGDPLSAVVADHDFRRDDPGREGWIVLERRSVTWRGREVSVPVPRPNPEAVAAMRADDDQTPAETVFDRLARVSNGNLGVAAALLDGLDGTVAPSDVVPVGSDETFDREEAYCLWALLGNERVRRGTLTAVVGAEASRIVGRFARAGIVTTDGAVVTLAPGAVPTATTAVQREGLL